LRGDKPDKTVVSRSRQISVERIHYFFIFNFFYMYNIFSNKMSMNSNFTSLITNKIDEIYKLVAEQVINNQKIKCKKTLVYNLETKKISSRKSSNSDYNYLIFEFNVNQHCQLTIDATISLSFLNGWRCGSERESLEKFGIKTDYIEPIRIYDQPLYTTVVSNWLFDAAYSFSHCGYKSDVTETLFPKYAKSIKLGKIRNSCKYLIEDYEIVERVDEVKMEDWDLDEINEKLEDFQSTLEDDDYNQYLTFDEDTWRVLASRVQTSLPRHQIFLYENNNYFDTKIAEMLLSYRRLNVDLLSLIA
jgi:hypothetical protein